MRIRTIHTFIALLILVALKAQAKPEYPIIDNLKWVDNGYLDRQRELVDSLGRSEFGVRVRQDKSDLHLLQRILDNELINQTETQKLQALGVVLGDVFAKETPLEWRTYLDEYGKSRALCMPGTEECLFPITMIYKRMSIGVKPNIDELYKHGLELIDPYLPKLPYTKKLEKNK